MYLETLEHLAILSKKDPAVVEADLLAQLVMERATELCIDAAGIPTPDWETDPTLVPGRVRTICLFVAFRTYNNPRSIINSSVGPISESILAAMAAAMTLTEAEREELENIAEENGDFGGLWVLQTTTGDESRLNDDVFIPDNSGSDWWIPFGTEYQTEAFNEMADGSVDPEEFNALVAQVQTLVTALGGKVSTQQLVDALVPKASVSAMNAALALKANQTSLDSTNTSVATKADDAATTTALAGKASTSALTSGLATKADSSALTSGLAAKADATATTAALATKADASATTSALAGKAATSVTDGLNTRLTTAEGDIDDLQTEIALKADTADLGAQVRVGTTAPTSGSGDVWADTDA